MVRVLLAAAALLWAAGFSGKAVADVSFRIEIYDEPDFGFNDPTPVDPVGGNPGTTLGDQRLNALREALEIWGAAIASPIEIVVAARWRDSDLVLATAEVAFWMRDFAGAPRANTWYPLALANKLAGVSFCPPPDGGDCGADYDMFLDYAAGHSFYLGLDGNVADSEFDLVSLSLHEIGHGLGFATRFGTPQKTHGPPESPHASNSIYHYFLEDHFIDRTFPQMSFFERLIGGDAGRYLHWIGPRGLAAAESLTAGRYPGGHLMLYGPIGGAGVSMIHLSPDIVPKHFMKVFLEGSPRDTTLAYSMLADIGWEEACPGDCDADGRVSVEELVLAVRMASERESLVRCAMLNVDDDGVVRIAELIRAVNSLLNGCKHTSPRPGEGEHQVFIEVRRRDVEVGSAFTQSAGEAYEAHLSGPAGGVLGRDVGNGYTMRSVVDSQGRVRAACGVGTEPAPE